MEASSAEHVLSERPDRELHLVSLGVNDLPHVWERVEPILARACAESRGEFSLPQILAEMGIHDGVERWRLLVLLADSQPQAVMVVCITQRGEDRVLDCLLAGGERSRDWPKVDDEFDAFARANGCSRVRVPCARKGWAKTLPHWKIRGYVMEREV